MQRVAALSVLALSLGAAAARGATPGFVEDFDGGTALFSGSTVTHVTSGGVDGTGDAYIEISNEFAGHLGANSTAVDLVGDLAADGVTGYSFWLRDTGANDDLEIHVGVGTSFLNYWESVAGFAPPDGSWQQFSVDLTDSAQWVQIIGTGTFQDALAATDRLLFRHDVPPLTQFPDAVVAEFGLDRIQVLPAPAMTPAASAPGRLALAALLGALAVAGLGLRGAAARAGD